MLKYGYYLLHERRTVKTTLKQSGSAHVVVIIILVVAVLGLLGFVFWQNFIKKTDDSATKQSTTTKVTNKESSANGVALVAKNLSTSDNLGITYKVPSTWSGGTYGGGDTLSDSESTTLTAPDGFVVTMTISRLIRGWTQDSAAATVLDAQKTSGTNLTWLVVDHNDGTNGPINLQVANNLPAPMVGEKKVAGSSISKLGTAEGSDVYLEIYGGYKTDMTLTDFNAKEAVKQAKAIFESVHFGS